MTTEDLITIKDLNLDLYLCIVVSEIFADTCITGVSEPNLVRTRELFLLSKEMFQAEYVSQGEIDLQLSRVIELGSNFNESKDNALGVILDYSNLVRNHKTLLTEFPQINYNNFMKSIEVGTRTWINQYDTHNILLDLLPFILEYKIKKGQSFKSPDKVFEYLTSKQQMDFLFNIDCLR